MNISKIVLNVRCAHLSYTVKSVAIATQSETLTNGGHHTWLRITHITF